MVNGEWTGMPAYSPWVRYTTQNTGMGDGVGGMGVEEQWRQELWPWSGQVTYLPGPLFLKPIIPDIPIPLLPSKLKTWLLEALSVASFSSSLWLDWTIDIHWFYSLL